MSDDQLKTPKSEIVVGAGNPPAPIHTNPTEKGESKMEKKEIFVLKETKEVSKTPVFVSKPSVDLGKTEGNTALYLAMVEMEDWKRAFTTHMHKVASIVMDNYTLVQFDKESSEIAWTDGKIVWLGGEWFKNTIGKKIRRRAMHESAPDLCTMKGFVYHELSHILWSPNRKADEIQRHISEYGMYGSLVTELSESDLGRISQLAYDAYVSGCFYQPISYGVVSRLENFINPVFQTELDALSPTEYSEYMWWNDPTGTSQTGRQQNTAIRCAPTGYSGSSNPYGIWEGTSSTDVENSLKPYTYYPHIGFRGTNLLLVDGKPILKIDDGNGFPFIGMNSGYQTNEWRILNPNYSMHQAWNILEDARIELKFIARHNNAKSYFTHSILETVFENSLLAKRVISSGETIDDYPALTYLLVYGRKYIPSELIASVKKSYLENVNDRKNQISDYYATREILLKDFTTYMNRHIHQKGEIALTKQAIVDLRSADAKPVDGWEKLMPCEVNQGRGGTVSDSIHSFKGKMWHGINDYEQGCYLEIDDLEKLIDEFITLNPINDPDDALRQAQIIYRVSLHIDWLMCISSEDTSQTPQGTNPNPKGGQEGQGTSGQAPVGVTTTRHKAVKTPGSKKSQEKDHDELLELLEILQEAKEAEAEAEINKKYDLESESESGEESKDESLGKTSSQGPKAHDDDGDYSIKVGNQQITNTVVDDIRKATLDILMPSISKELDVIIESKGEVVTVPKEAELGKHWKKPVTPSMRIGSMAIARSIQKIWSDTEPQWASEKISGRLNVGQALRSVASHRPTTKIFDQWDDSGETNDFEVICLADLSVSMTQSMLRDMSQAIWVIRKACSTLTIPCTVFGYSDNSTLLFDSNSRVHPNEYVGLESRGNTKPQDAITWAYQKFSKSKAKHKLLFSLTDGEWHMTNHSKAYLSRMNSFNVESFLCFMSPYKRFSHSDATDKFGVSLYGHKYFLPLEEISTFPQQVAEVIARLSNNA